MAFDYFSGIGSASARSSPFVGFRHPRRIQRHHDLALSDKHGLRLHSLDFFACAVFARSCWCFAVGLFRQRDSLPVLRATATALSLAGRCRGVDRSARSLSTRRFL